VTRAGGEGVSARAATAHGVLLTITPNALHEGVAEQALALILAVAKGVVRLDRATRAGSWPILQTEPLRGKTLGLVGLGRIGRSTAVRAAAFGMQVIATETDPDGRFVAEHGIGLVDFDTLLARSDYLSVHCPLNAETRGLFDARAFARMKPGSVFINTARGGLVVEADLLAALRSGHLRGAGLDVFEKEPTAADDPLFQPARRRGRRPARGGGDRLSVETVAVDAARSVARLSRGEWPEGAVVNHELKGRWRW
jgi:phosphoglycerate dehydrogenase-like enzyme